MSLTTFLHSADLGLASVQPWISLCNVGGPQQGIIYTFCLVGYVCDDLVVTTGITVASRGEIPLWCHPISVPAPWGDKCCEVPIVFMQWHTVIPVPCIKHCFFVSWGTDLAWIKGDWVWWISRVVCLLRGWKSTVRRGLPFFGADNHPVALIHHVIGSPTMPTGTGSTTPSRTSWSRPVLTSSIQCKGTRIGAGVW